MDDDLVLSALKRYARHMALKGRVKPGLVLPDAAPRNPAQLAELESAAKCLDLYLWLARRFPREFGHLEAAQTAALKTQRLIEEGLQSIGAEALEEAKRRRELAARKGERGAAGAAGAEKLSSLFSADDDALEAALLHGNRGAGAGLLQGFFGLRGARSTATGEGTGSSGVAASSGWPGPRIAARFERTLKKLEQRAFAAVRPHLQALQADATPPLGPTGDSAAAAIDDVDDGGDEGSSSGDVGYSHRQQARERAAARAAKLQQAKKGKAARMDPAAIPGFESVGQGGPRYEGDMQALANGLRRVMTAAMRRAGLLDDQGRLTRKAMRGKKPHKGGKGQDSAGFAGDSRSGFAAAADEDLMMFAGTGGSGDRAFGGLPRGAEVASIIKQLQRLKGKAMAARQREEAGRSSGGGWRRPRDDDSDDDDDDDEDLAFARAAAAADDHDDDEDQGHDGSVTGNATTTKSGSAGAAGDVDDDAGDDSDNDAAIEALAAELAASQNTTAGRSSSIASGLRVGSAAAVMSPAAAAAFGLAADAWPTGAAAADAWPTGAAAAATGSGASARSGGSKRTSLLDAPLTGLRRPQAVLRPAPPTQPARGQSNRFR